MPNFTSIALYKGRQNIPCIHKNICFIDIMTNKSYLLTHFSASRFVRYCFRRNKNARTNKQKYKKVCIKFVFLNTTSKYKENYSDLLN